jgi:hypothetical protein
MRAPRFALSAVPVASALIYSLSACAHTTVQSGTTQSVTQSARVGLTGGAGVDYGNLTGSDFDGTQAGVGFDVNAGATYGAWQLGLGYDRTNHSHADSYGGDFVVSNLYLEPRYQFMSSKRRLTPYVAARVGKSMASFDESYGGTSDASGLMYGLGAGVLWPLAKSVQVDGAVHYAHVTHDYGSGDYSESEKGNQISMRAGIRIFR